MATFAKNKLSGSTNGRGIKVVQTATDGTTIHTATAGTGYDFDEVYLWATNTDTTDRKLTLQWGGVASPDDSREVTIPAECGPVAIVPGWVLQNGLIIRAFAATANVIIIDGYVHEIRT